jgi:hypothetical protein
MPTVLSHAVFGAALYLPFRRHLVRHAALVGAFAAVVTDLDVSFPTTTRVLERMR